MTFEASVNYTGRTSREISIRVTTQDVRAGAIRHTNTCHFTMVAMGDDAGEMQRGQAEIKAGAGLVQPPG